MNNQIVGNQADNAYSELLNNQQGASSNPPIDHQAAFEAQMKGNQQHVHEENVQNDMLYAFEQNGTYCRTGTIENGFIETDLQIYKEKGTETRFVSFSVLSLMDEKQIEETKQRNGMAYITMMMTSEEQFNRFKDFVSKLSWND